MLQRAAPVGGSSAGGNSALAGLAALPSFEPQVYSDVATALLAGNAAGAMTVLTRALGVPDWGVTAFTSLLSGDVVSAESAVLSAMSGSSDSTGSAPSTFTLKYVKLALEHALNASGAPASIAEQPEVVAGLASGNATRVLRGLSTAYGLPVWAADAVVALSGTARPSPRGLAVLLSTSDASSRVTQVLNRYNVSAELAALGLGVEYEKAASAADIATLASLLGSVADVSSSSGRRLAEGNQTALGALLSRVVLAVSTASQLQAALQSRDVALAATALVGALGELHSPLGRTLEAVVKASSLSVALSSASTVPQIAAVVSSAMELLPLDPLLLDALVGLTRVGSLSSQLALALAARPVDARPSALAPRTIHAPRRLEATRVAAPARRAFEMWMLWPQPRSSATVLPRRAT